MLQAKTNSNRNNNNNNRNLKQIGTKKKIKFPKLSSIVFNGITEINNKIQKSIKFI